MQEQKQFVLLDSFSDIEFEMARDRLKQAGIPCKYQSYNQNAFLNIYGADTVLGKQVFVPRDKLDTARKLLELDKMKEKATFSYSTNKRPFFKVLRILALILFLAIIIGMIVNVVTIWLNS